MHFERIIPDQHYGEFYSSFAEHIRRYAFASRSVGTAGTVLDLGSGCGYGSAYLAEVPGRVIIGLDRSHEATKYASMHYQGNRLSYLVGDASVLPVKTESIDAVIALEIVEHIKNIESTMLEIKRVLKRQGIFIASTPNRLVTGTEKTPTNPYHIREYTPNEFEALLTPLFKNVIVYGQALTPATLAGRENMQRIWHNLSLIPVLYHEIQSLHCRLVLDERITGLSLLRRLKRWCFGQSRGAIEETPPDINQRFRHPPFSVSSMQDWDISPYQLKEAPVIVAVCTA